jgi:hypothetical protein
MIVRVSGRRVPILLAAALLLAAPIISALSTHTAYADQITQRSLTLQTGAGGDGGSKPGGTVNHLFTFTVPTNGPIGAVMLLYCTTASGSNGDVSEASCTTPTGLSTSGVSTGPQGANATGFTLDTVNSTNGKVILTKASPAAPSPALDLSFRLDDVVNPSAANETFFVRIKTFSDSAATTLVDTGTVAASTATQIQLTGTMPESLIFCAGATVAANAGIPDCSQPTDGAVVFDKLFSPTDTATATSQMAASTNATNGYAITVHGGTLTSGSNTIPAMSTAATSIKSTGQFGMNLVQNVDFCGAGCNVGANITPGSDVPTQLLGNPTANYATDGTFKFDSASSDVVARSDYGGTYGTSGALGATNGQIFTASYIVNVPGSQAPGTYTTTLTYVCTPTF